MKANIAVFFDFDGTMTKSDSFLEFIKFTHSPFQLYYFMARQTPYIVQYLMGVYPNHLLKERFFSHFYKGMSSSELLEKGQHFALHILPQLCCKKAIKTLRSHQIAGHDLYLLTASSSIWLEAWSKKQGFTFIGTEFQVEGGKYTGKIRGKNCYGREKLRRIEPLLPQYRYTVGYGDRLSDSHFLSALNEGHYGSLCS